LLEQNMNKKLLLPLTPAQVEGPFYPVNYHVNEGSKLTQGKAEGEFIIVAGTVKDQSGQALENVLVEIWQADNHGRYDHPGDSSHPNAKDPHFNYFGKTVTNHEGKYLFETIKPAPYNDDGDWRTPHIHFKIYRKRNICALTTQLYFVGEALNEQDNHIGTLPKEQQKQLLTQPEKKGLLYGLGAETLVHEFHLVV